MGIIKKQAFLNSIFNYAGIVIGYVNVVLLFPHVFSSEEFGLTRVLAAIATLYVQFSSLGINKVQIKFFPFFKTPEKKHRGFFLFVLLVPLLGFSLITLLYFIFNDFILDKYQGESKLFNDYFYLVIPLALLLLYSSIVDSYLQSLYKTVLPNLLTHVAIRVYWLIEILLFHFGFIDFQTFIILYILSYAVNLLITTGYLLSTGEISLKIEWNYFKPRVLKLIANYGLFSILSNVSVTLVRNIDIIMIGFLIGLAESAIYSVAFYISSVVAVPALSIGKIAYPIVSASWKEKKFGQLKELYEKSSLNQMLFGGFIFVCIWVNIHNLFQILPPEYEGGKYAIFFIAMAKLFDMLTGINGQIIITSKYYRFDTIAILFLGIVTVLTNYLLIPLYGITGAALATMSSFFLYNAAKYFFILQKLNLQPFTYKTFLGLLILGGSYLLVSFIPHQDNYMVDLLMRVVIITLVFFPAIYVLKISEDINDLIAGVFNTLKNFIK